MEESVVSWGLVLLLSIIGGIVFWNKFLFPDNRTPEQKEWDKLLVEHDRECFKTWEEVHNVKSKCKWWMTL